MTATLKNLTLKAGRHWVVNLILRILFSNLTVYILSYFLRPWSSTVELSGALYVLFDIQACNVFNCAYGNSPQKKKIEQKE